MRAIDIQGEFVVKAGTAPLGAVRTIHIHLAKSRHFFINKEMAVFHVSPHRIGQLVLKGRSMISQLDRGMRTASKVYHAVKEHVPEGKIKKAAEKGLSSYESIREKVRQGADMP